MPGPPAAALIETLGPLSSIWASIRYAPLGIDFRFHALAQAQRCNFETALTAPGNTLLGRRLRLFLVVERFSSVRAFGWRRALQ